ncbi:MAG: thioesterase family protein [Pyrinomonadaceae bacterium]
MHSLLKDFPVAIELPVVWGEMDAFQHVNNIVYFRYFESARMAYFEKLDLWNFMKETGIGPIQATAQCRFRIPLTAPDTVTVGTKVSRIEADRFLMEFAVLSHQHQKVAAEGQGMIVSYNYREKKKTPLPEAIKERIEALEGGTRKTAATDQGRLCTS